MGIKTAVTGGG